MMLALTVLTVAVTALLTLAGRGRVASRAGARAGRRQAAGVALMQVATLAHDRRSSVPAQRRAKERA